MEPNNIHLHEALYKSDILRYFLGMGYKKS